DDEDQAFAGRSLARPLVLGQTLPAFLRAVGGVEPGEGRAGEPKRLLQTFTGPAEGGGLLGRDFGLGAPQALAGSAAHSKSPDLDDEDQAFAGRSLARPLVLGQTLPAFLRAVGGVEPGEGRAGEPKRLLQTFTGPAEGGGLLGRDFGLGAPQALAGSAAHSKSTAFTSHCWRWRNWVIVSTTRASTTPSRLMMSGRMCRTAG